MQTASIDDVKERIATPHDEKQFIPLLLFRGNLKMGRAMSLWNFTLAMKDAEIPSLAMMAKIGRESPDLLHYCGLHHSLPLGSVRQFLSRVWSSPEMLRLEPGLRDYLGYAAAEDPCGLFTLTPIARWSVWSKQGWRRVRPASSPEVPQFYPFLLNAEPSPEHNLIMLVDGAVPRGIPEQMRADVCQDMIVGILSGELSEEHIADQAAAYVRSMYRRFPIKYGVSHSLDTPRSADDDRSFQDILDHRQAYIDPLAWAERAENARVLSSIIGSSMTDETVLRIDDETIQWYRHRLSEEGLAPRGVVQRIDPILTRPHRRKRSKKHEAEKRRLREQSRDEAAYDRSQGGRGKHAAPEGRVGVVRN